MKNILETLVGSRKMDDYFDLIIKVLIPSHSCGDCTAS